MSTTPLTTRGGLRRVKEGLRRVKEEIFHLMLTFQMKTKEHQMKTKDHQLKKAFVAGKPRPVHICMDQWLNLTKLISKED